MLVVFKDQAKKKIKTFKEFFGGKTEKVQNFDRNNEIHKTKDPGKIFH